MYTQLFVYTQAHAKEMDVKWQEEEQNRMEAAKVKEQGWQESAMADRKECEKLEQGLFFPSCFYH
jgi:hypothetical protein